MNLVAPLAGLAVLIAADPAGLTLRGTVVDAGGRPVAGARVDIATAAPRAGPALFCPSCYRDCAKSTRSDGQGRFEIDGLDPNLKFTVLVSSPGRKAHLTRLTDPLVDEVRVALAAQPAVAPPERTVLARVVDDRGQAIAGALV